MNSDDFNALIANGRIHISDKLTKVFDDNHKLMAHIVVPQIIWSILIFRE